ncbi:unnamed protein product [Ectocarpus sp. 12 AP-2014]
MDVEAILGTSAVRSVGTITSKKRLFQELGDLAGAAYGLKTGNVASALQERESLGPTGVGQGIALPHARLEGLDRVLGLFVRLDQALEFDSVDKQPVDLVFGLLAPQDAGVEHLKALALVSRTMRDGGLCTKLRANADTATLHTLLTEPPKSQAA